MSDNPMSPELLSQLEISMFSILLASPIKIKVVQTVTPIYWSLVRQLMGEMNVLFGTRMSLEKALTVSKDRELQQLTSKIANKTFMADDTKEALEIIRSSQPELVLLDFCSSPIHTKEFLEKTKEVPINIPKVVITDRKKGDLELPDELLQTARKCLLEDKNDLAGLQYIVNQVESNPESQASYNYPNYYFAKDFAAEICLVGRSKAMTDALEMIELVACSRCNPILILGETGTGKELAARAVHHLRHPQEKFVAINCAALTANLLESELFGHTKGSFTGADRDKTGLLELAGNGTIFLDEISEMPFELQSKLLRVLQEKTFRKVGGLKDITCNATIIASSNQALQEQVKKKRFRSDLYYRLNVFPITMAPLRASERKSDIKLLAQFILCNSGICPHKAKKIKALTKLAVETLEQHNWPGNVRELRNVIEKGILLEKTDKIGLSSIVIDSYDSQTCSDSPLSDQQQKINDFSLEKAERELITRALKETGWQKTRAASLLGITRATLYAKVKQYNIKEEDQNARSKTTPQGKTSELPREPVEIR